MIEINKHNQIILVSGTNSEEYKYKVSSQVRKYIKYQNIKINDKILR